MNRLTIATLFVVAASAFGQNIGPSNPAGFAPNFYNRQSQPLSPYLNLLRGGNNAVNYFYGARPGTPAGGFSNMMSQQQNLGQRQTFFPVVDTLSDLLPEEQRGAPRMPATGHPVAFFNTLNYFGQGPAAPRAPGPQPQRRVR